MKTKYVIEYYNDYTDDYSIQGCEPDDPIIKDLKRAKINFTINKNWELVFESEADAMKAMKKFEDWGDYEFRVVSI